MRGAQQYAPKADPRREAAVEDLMSQVTGVFFAAPARRYDSQPFAELWRSPAFLPGRRWTHLAAGRSCSHQHHLNSVR